MQKYCSKSLISFVVNLQFLWIISSNPCTKIVAKFSADLQSSNLQVSALKRIHILKKDKPSLLIYNLLSTKDQELTLSHSLQS